MYITESTQIPVKNRFDVAVCGGGFAGISAALAAARQGKKTVLFERQFMLGGLGTAGLVTIYLPLCDGFGRQICHGISEELFHLSITHGAEDKYPDNWLREGGSRTEHDLRFEVQYNAQLFAIMAEKLLMDEGVTILYGTYAVGVHMQDGKITHLITENKSGREAYQVSSVVDATGDCDIAKFAGAPVETFKQGNILAAWYYSVGAKGYHLNTIGFCDVPEEEKEKQDQVPLLVNRRFAGLEGEEISQFVRLSHQSTYQNFLEKREKDGTLLPVTVATIPQLRMTRHFVGEHVLSDKESHTYMADSVGMVSNWKKRGPVYEVPFRSLYSKKVKNLICAGRCTSVTETMWDIMRVIPCCAVTGQAAGTAAALTDDFTALDIELLQKKLVSAGVILHERDL